jgi:hypothetical protein
MGGVICRIVDSNQRFALDELGKLVFSPNCAQPIPHWQRLAWGVKASRDDALKHAAVD